MGVLKYDVKRRDYPLSTPLMMVRPEAIKVLTTDSGTMAFYQKQMSKAIWRPAPGRKLGFVVMQDQWILGLIFLASPVIRLEVRDKFLFPEADTKFKYGTAMNEYMDVSVCVAAQPVGWYWNLGKLMALLAPTLGEHVEGRYMVGKHINEKFKGVTTTSLWGRSTQYNRIYKHLGYTKGHGHEHINDVEYEKMKDYLRSRCPNCTPECKEEFLPLIPKQVDPKDETKGLLPESEWCTVPYARFGDGANARMRCIAAYRQASGDKTVTLVHGKLRGVYYHPAVPPEQRQAVINKWYERWGLPRYERMKNEQPPYNSGLEGKPA